MRLSSTKPKYINHALTFSAEPICGASLIPPGKDDELTDCPACEAVIGRTLDLLAKLDSPKDRYD